MSLAGLCAHSQNSDVHLNQIQVIGTHNSYNLGFAPSEEKLAHRFNERGYESLEYRQRRYAFACASSCGRCQPLK